jgi:GNAT superfamily N-acetyltransferase
MLTIRKASLRDYQTIVDIMRKSATEEELRGFVPPEGVPSEFLKKIKDGLNQLDNGVILAESEGFPVGFAFYRLTDDSVEVEEVDVRKEFQGRGVGRALVQHVENVARERGVRRLVTGTSINVEGKPWRAYGFWVRMGFVDTGERIDGPLGLKYVKFVKQLRT